MPTASFTPVTGTVPDSTHACASSPRSGVSLGRLSPKCTACGTPIRRSSQAATSACGKPGRDPRDLIAPAALEEALSLGG
ncbi:MAG: hypothetical protein AAFQ12_14775, partial [Pseudomonadota bacterium]